MQQLSWAQNNNLKRNKQYHIQSYSDANLTEKQQTFSDLPHLILDFLRPAETLDSVSYRYCSA